MTDERRSHDDHWRAVLSRPLDVSPFQPLSSMVSLEVAAASACGPACPQNTDHYLAVRLSRLQETLLSSLSAADLPPRFDEDAYALLVADGLDGKDAGGVRASRVALSALAHLAIRYGKWNVRVGMDTASEIVAQGEFLYRQINDAVRDASRADGRLADMATSLTAVYIAGADLFFAHVGHSRACLFRNGALIQLTTDHTLERLRRDVPRTGPWNEQTRDLPHQVTETIGGRPSPPDVAIEHIQLWSGDRVLLCTNGLTDVICDDEIADVLASQRRPSDDCHRLVEKALSAGSADNVTVVLADYSIRSRSAVGDPGDWADRIN